MPAPARPRATLSILFFTIFLDLVGLGIAIPVLAPLLISPFGILSPAVPLQTRTILYGCLVAVYPLFQFFGAPMLGALSDRYGRRNVLLLSLLGTLIGYVLTAIGILTRNLPLIFVSRALDGFTGGNIATAQSAIADVSAPQDRARNFGLIGMAFGLGFILGPFIGGKLADPSVVAWFRPHTPFWGAALLSVLNIVLVLRLFPETLHTRVATKVSLLTGFRNIGRALKLAHLRSILLVTFLLTLGFNFFTQFFQVFLIERFGFLQGDIGDLFAYMGLWIAVTQGLINRPLARRFAPEKIVRFSALALGLVLPLLLLAPTAGFLFVILPLIAMANGLTHPNTVAIVSRLAGDESQGEILGINQSVQSLAMILPPLIAGYIASIHPHLPTLAASLFILAAWVVFVCIFRKRPREQFHEV